jgi:26S proteasome regulatory subunit T1
MPTPPPPELTLLMTDYAQRDPLPATLSTLLGFASPMTSDSVLASAEYTLNEVPRRIAKRVQALEALPFIVGTNPFIFNVLNAYRDSFQRLASRKPVNTLEDNKTFIEDLNHMVKAHANDIATMAKGCVYECLELLSVANNNETGSRSAQSTCNLMIYRPSLIRQSLLAYPSDSSRSNILLSRVRSRKSS